MENPGCHPEVRRRRVSMERIVVPPTPTSLTGSSALDEAPPNPYHGSVTSSCEESHARTNL
jgi:hypothetical protein